MHITSEWLENATFSWQEASLWILARIVGFEQLG
jgi:hypothetical protein